MTNLKTQVDTFQLRSIRRSPSKLVLEFVLWGIAAGMSFEFMTSDTSSNPWHLFYGIPYDWIITAVCAFLALLALTRLIGWRRVIIEISPVGIRDRRARNEMVRWKEITSVESRRCRGGSFVRLMLNPNADKRVYPWPLSRGLHLLSSILGYSGLTMDTTNLETNTKQLLEMCDAYWKAYRGS